MRTTVLATVALAAMVTIAAPASSQGISIGPGGVQIDDGRRGRDYDRDYRDERRARRVCAELRDACRYGEEGQGNCRRYRRNCE